MLSFINSRRLNARRLQFLLSVPAKIYSPSSWVEMRVLFACDMPLFKSASSSVVKAIVMPTLVYRSDSMADI